MPTTATGRPGCTPEDHGGTLALPAAIRAVVPRLLRALGHERPLQVIVRHFGLDGQPCQSLQAIGHAAGLTRERVRQLQARGLRALRPVLLERQPSPGDTLTETIRAEVAAFVPTLDRIVTERDIRAYVRRGAARELTPADDGAIQLLLTLLGYAPLRGSLRGRVGPLEPAWATAEVDRPQLYATIRAIERAMVARDTPIGLADLRGVVEGQRRVALDDAPMRLALSLCRGVEVLDSGAYQLCFDRLPTVADQAYRVLAAQPRPLHVREIVAQINERLRACGAAPDAGLRNLHNQLVADARFVPHGRSGRWSLRDGEWSCQPGLSGRWPSSCSG